MRFFISYRRTDSEDVSGRLYDHLERRVGSHAIFKDVDSIPFGHDFRDSVRDAISRTDVMLALIGPKWLDATDERGRRRLANPADWVRIEIETALAARVVVVPLLLGTTSMPRDEDLPAGLKPLAFRNAARLRPDPDFKRDVDLLCANLGVPEPPEAGAPTRLKSLHVSYLKQEKSGLRLRYTLLFGSAAATVPVTEQLVAREDLDRIVRQSHQFDALPALGEELIRQLLPSALVGLLEEDPDDYLLIFHDRATARIPWERVRIGGVFPALRAGLSRRVLIDASGVPSRRPASQKTSVLIISNPTNDLPGAAEEGDALEAVIRRRFPATTIARLTGLTATRPRVLETLHTGQYDLVHFSGHGFHDPKAPEKSGILVAGQVILTSRDLAAFSSPPRLIFISAAEGAQLSDNPRGAPSFAEGLLRSGVENYIAPMWPEGDAAAVAFTTHFYDALFRGSTIGTALREARRHLWESKQPDALNYVHIGLPENRVLL